GDDEVAIKYSDDVRKYETRKPFEGVVNNLQRRWRETDSAWMREELERYQTSQACEACGGKRLKPEALAVKIARKNIAEISELSIADAATWFAGLQTGLTGKQMEIARRILREIDDRLHFLNNVGLEYLTLSR